MARVHVTFNFFSVTEYTFGDRVLTHRRYILCSFLTLHLGLLTQRLIHTTLRLVVVHTETSCHRR
jgi:hypothetical protein